MDDFDFGDWGGGSDNNNYNTNYNDYGDYTQPQGPVAPAPTPSYDYGDYSDYGNNNQPAPQQYGGATDDYGNPMGGNQVPQFPGGGSPQSNDVYDYGNPQGPVQPDSGYYGEGSGGYGDQGMTQTSGMPDQGPMGPQMPPGMRSRGMPGQGAAGQQPGQQGPGPAGQKSGGFLDSLGGLLGGGKGSAGGGLGGIPDWLLAAGGAGLAAYAIPKLMQMGGPSAPNVQAPAQQAGPPIPTFGPANLGGGGFAGLKNAPVVGMQMGMPVQKTTVTPK
jgi:hypothetical protein